MDSDQTVDASVVILSMGDRPKQLSEAISSVSQQIACKTEIILVWNGLEAIQEVKANQHISIKTNIGIPAGRNKGAAFANNELIMFLDDDAKIISPDLLANAAARFRNDDSLGVIALRILDEFGITSRRHIPRLGDKSADISGITAGFLGGACIVRRKAWEEINGYSGDLFYGMEETDLSWRIIDAGWKIFYDAELKVEHPHVKPSRHSEGIRLTARNRVWIAKSNLPVILAPIYILNWLLISILRNLKSPRALKSIFIGNYQGMRENPLERKVLKWKTIATLFRIGRPPII